jgi:hypothetical protein
VNDTGNPFDPKSLRITPEEQKAPRPAQTEPKRQPFILVPAIWDERLCGAAASTQDVARHLLREHWRNGGRSFKLANKALAKRGTSPNGKLRALKELERLGLINVERGLYRSPIVTVLLAHKPGTAA